MTRGLLLIGLCVLSFACTAEQLIIGGSGTDLSTFRILGQAFRQYDADTDVIIKPSVGSSGGIKGVQSNVFDLGLLSRAPKPAEQSPNLNFHYYARTAQVFAVSADNPVDNISTQQIADIYAGKLTQWPDGQPARPILRPATDSDILMLNNFIPQFRSALPLAYQRRELVIAQSDEEAAQMIENITGAVGSTTLALIKSEHKSLKTLTLDGVDPHTLTQASVNYPIYKSLFVVYKNDHSNRSLQSFLQFLESETARDILRATGHINLPQP